ncbi:protein LplC [Paenibacillus sp. J31TS4]|uniref:carbohydrate ABC transporter permease n=1 Tax=Paenibacillus sp. J31TS4 TaxID=2807195 RepID=UPI001B05A13C|nr:carbohydrate ABC transporter permease [Paenibacillus sp. J31TS4]GIP38005.1 protein LplC [Paenibacillus sp. J31TS4]
MDKSIGSRFFSAANHTFLVLLGVMMMYPLWREISLSFSSKEEALRGGLFLWPKHFTLDAYRSILKSDYIWTAYGNSLFITIVGTVLALFFTSCTAYPLAKRTLPFKKVFVSFVLFTMIFSGGLIPTYLVMKELHLINSLWAVIVLHLVSAFNVIIMMNFIRTLPEELEESAMMDGANPIRIFFVIILPLCKPVLATLALWIAVGLWNNFFHSFIYLNDKSLMTLPVLLRLIIAGQKEADQLGEAIETSSESVIAATIVISLLPILSVYPFLQKYFIKGTLLGSVKA